MPPSKKVIWKALREYCKDCHGESVDDSVCQDMAVHGECELYVYKRRRRRQDANGMMLPIYKKPEVMRRIRGNCERICLNGYSTKMCSSPKCALYPIVNHRKVARMDNRPGKTRET
jgi:hypothetical protein